MITPLLKPKDQKRRRKPHIIVRSDGKEICDRSTQGGRVEYKTRTLIMFRRQKGICRWCCLPMIWEDATFDHDNGRTKGNQDDRIVVEGKEQNAAVHDRCNCERGSMRYLTRAEWQASKIFNPFTVQQSQYPGRLIDPGGMLADAPVDPARQTPPHSADKA